MKKHTLLTAAAMAACIVYSSYCAAENNTDNGNFQRPPTQYTSFEGVSSTLYPYVGRHVALLTTKSNLNKTVLKKIIDVMDRSYDYYQGVTGRTPEISKSYEDRTTIAVVSKTCGHACGNVGSTGIQLTPTAFDDLYNGILSKDEYNQTIFYEFGRNFWFYGDKLEYKDPDDADTVTTGFAVFMRFMVIENLGINPGPFHDQDFAYFKSEVKGLLARYLADPSLTWENTLKVGNAPDNPMDLGSTDLFASFLFKLQDMFGNEFVNKFWKEVDKRPDAATTQDAVDNFILAASAAARKNLTNLFLIEWRWPVSNKAQAEALKRFGNP